MIKTLRELRTIPKFYRFFTARTISNFGNGISPVALAFGVLGIAGANAGSLSLVQGARTLPILLLLVVGGTIADKYGRAKVMGLTDMWLSALILIAAFSFIAGFVSIWLLVLVGLLAGLLNGIWYPAFAGLMPIIVPEEHLQKANAATGFGSNVAFMLGTASGGVIVATFNVGWALAIDALTFLVAGALVYPLSKLPQEGKAEAGEKVNFLKELKLGWKEFKSRSWLVAVVVGFAFLNMTFEAVWAVLGALQSLKHYSGAATWGLILGFMSLGFLLGTIIANKARPKHPLRLIVGLMLTEPLFLLVFGSQQPLPFVLLSAVAFGISMDFFYVMWSTTIQQNIPSEALSRVNSYDSFGSFVFGPIGIIIAGPIAVTIGIDETMIAGSVIGALALFGCLLVPSVRNLEAKFTN